jgi:hypothetical protein
MKRFIFLFSHYYLQLCYTHIQLLYTIIRCSYTSLCTSATRLFLNRREPESSPCTAVTHAAPRSPHASSHGTLTTLLLFPITQNLQIFASLETKQFCLKFLFSIVSAVTALSLWAVGSCSLLWHYCHTVVPLMFHFVLCNLLSRCSFPVGCGLMCHLSCSHTPSPLPSPPISRCSLPVVCGLTSNRYHESMTKSMTALQKHHIARRQYHTSQNYTSVIQESPRILPPKKASTPRQVVTLLLHCCYKIGILVLHCCYTNIVTCSEQLEIILQIYWYSVWSCCRRIRKIFVMPWVFTQLSELFLQFDRQISA